MPDCLICGKETTATNMGMDVCRACTVFYRRNQIYRGKFECIKGTGKCKDYRKGIYTCRKCRLDRFEAVMAHGRIAGLVKQEQHIPQPCSSSEWSTAIPDRLKFGCDSAMEGTSMAIHTPPLTPTMSAIERIRIHHRILSIMRRTAEFQLRGIWMDPFEADKEEYELVPCTYQLMNEGTRILVVGLCDFIPAVFPEFNTLSVEDKWLLIRNYQKIFHMIDSSLRIARRYWEDPNVGFGSYTSYLSMATADDYFSDCPNQENVLEAAKTLRDCLQENCVRMKKNSKRVKLTEEEYLALMGIAFWTFDTVNEEPTGNFEHLASRYRAEILSDLKERYRQTIGEEEGVIRVGELYGMLMGLKAVEMKQKWEYEVYRMLNVFNDDTYMYKLQRHRADIDGNEMQQ